MIRARSGPFVEQPYYAADDFDSMAIAELGRVDLLPAEPGPTRVDRFIEKRFGIIPKYDDLPAGGLSRLGSRINTAGGDTRWLLEQTRCRHRRVRSHS